MKASAVILTAIAAAMACDAYPTEPGSSDAAVAFAAEQDIASNGVVRDVEESVVDYTDVLWAFTCDGEESELIDMEGVIRHRVTFLDDGAGGLHYRSHVIAHGLRGVGVDSGDSYRAVEVSHESYNGPAMGQHAGFVENVLLVGRGGRGFRYMATGRYSINANGDLVVDLYREDFTCTL